MKRSIKIMLAGVMAVPLLALGLSVALPSSSVGATVVQEGANQTQTTDGGQPSKLFGDDGVFTNIVNAILYVIGIVCVIMIIYGGVLYTLSGGDGTKVTNAKNTIMYAIVGLIVAILAYAIVNWVLGSLAGTTT